jgi:hypothetical protein
VALWLAGAALARRVLAVLLSEDVLLMLLSDLWPASDSPPSLPPAPPLPAEAEALPREPLAVCTVYKSNRSVTLEKRLS